MILDADGTLYDLIGGLIRDIRNRFAYVLHREDFRIYSLANLVPDRPDINRHIIDCLQDAKFYYNLEPFPGVAEALLPLAEYGKLVLVTARRREFLRATGLAVARDFPGVTITCEHRKGEHKGAVVNSLPDARVAFEDNTDAALDYLKRGLKVYLIGPPQAPYNGGYLPKHRNLTVSGTFPEAVEKFQATRIPGVMSGKAS